MNDISIRISDSGINIDLGQSRSVSFSGDTYTPPAPPAPKRFTIGDGSEPKSRIVHDSQTGLTWSGDDVTDKAVNWDKADKACRDLRLGGHDDWRLPTRAELLTLVDDTKHDPAIDADAFPNCKSAYYWTSTPYAASPSDFAWVVYFSYGLSYGADRGDDCRVRAVRGSSRQ